MDGVVWFTGTEGAIMMALDEPEAFGELVALVAETDCARTELALSSADVDLVVMRGWYSSTDFWSPRLFEEFVYPHIVELAALAQTQWVRKVVGAVGVGGERGDQLEAAGGEFGVLTFQLQLVALGGGHLKFGEDSGVVTGLG